MDMTMEYSYGCFSISLNGIANFVSTKSYQTTP